jgi:hypothetical protein
MALKSKQVRVRVEAGWKAQSAKQPVAKKKEADTSHAACQRSPLIGESILPLETAKTTDNHSNGPFVKILRATEPVEVNSTLPHRTPPRPFRPVPSSVRCLV